MEAVSKENAVKTVTLPAGVLTGHVLPFVGVKTLKRCACVCREWRKAVDQDVIWKNQCLILWRNKRNVPRIVHNGGVEEPETLYPYAIYPPSLKLSLKEIKQILSLRDVTMSNFIERSEFQRALELSQPKRVGGWDSLYDSKWKCSYVYSAVRATKDRITRHELITTTWQMEFKFNGMRSESKFLGDGTYWSTLGNINQNQELRWVPVPNSDGSTFDFTGVRVGEYRKLNRLLTIVRLVDSCLNGRTDRRLELRASQ